MALAAVGLLLVTTLVLFLPGALVASAGGLPVPVALAAAPLLTYGLATASSTVAGLVDLPWSPWLLLAEAAVLAAVLWFVRRRRATTTPWAGAHWAALRRPRRADLAIAAGVLGGALVSMAVAQRAYGGLGRPNQDWDYTFHANAVRVISDTGDVSPGALQIINDWESAEFFYPNAYHAIAAVVRDLTGGSVFEVLNAQSLFIGALAGLGLAVLLRELRAPVMVTATTPVLLSAFTAFPYDLLWRGPLLPYATGLALLPAFVLLVRAAVERRLPVLVFLAGLGGAALLGLQPAAALAGAVMALCLVVQRWTTMRRVPGREAGLLAAAGLVAAVVGAPSVLGSLRTGAGAATQVDWEAVQTIGQSIGDLLVLNHAAARPQLVLAALLLIGLAMIRSAGYMGFWLAGTVVAGFLFVLASASDAELAETLTRPWWNDRWRFVAWAVLGFAPLAAHGLWRVTEWVRGLLARRRPPGAGRRRAPTRSAGALIAVGATLLATVVLYAPRNVDRVAQYYDDEHYLSTAETVAMDWLADRIEPGQTVMNDPGDGSAYLLALQGIRPLFGHQVPAITYDEAGPTRQALLERFRCLDTDPTIRDAIDRLDIGYVFVSTGYVREEAERVPGLLGLDLSPSLPRVYSRDGVDIYRVDLQPPAETPLPGCGATA
ncbi:MULTISPECIES: DUF6541 family protein [unclassified Modestobacter]